jgi:GT2 family glycosyltransferase
MKSFNVIAVVVTYNRLHLLRHTVACLKAGGGLSAIVVVNNASTDGTGEWLDAQADLRVIHQSNVGGSGGFYTGMQEAFKLGADWIWCMDDDVAPRADCLEGLMAGAEDPAVGILVPRRLMDEAIFTNEFRRYNLVNPFSSMYGGKLSKEVVTAPVDIAGAAFEGLCIRRQVVAAIGLPNKDLFIFCDDTDYCLRTLQAGYRIRYLPDALMDKANLLQHDSWANRHRKKKWKRFYQLRNAAYLNHRYGRNRAVRYFRSFLGVAGEMTVATVSMAFTSVYSFRDIARMWGAYRDGVNERLGIYPWPNASDSTSPSASK